MATVVKVFLLIHQHCQPWSKWVATSNFFLLCCLSFLKKRSLLPACKHNAGDKRLHPHIRFRFQVGVVALMSSSKTHLSAHSGPLWRHGLAQFLYWQNSVETGEEGEVGQRKGCIHTYEMWPKSYRYFKVFQKVFIYLSVTILSPSK